MMDPTTYLSGFALGFVAGMSPGPDTVLVLRAVATGGRAWGVRAAAGIGAGLLVLASLAWLATSALQASLPALLPSVTLAGAGYLAYLAAKLLRSALGPTPGPVAASARAADRAISPLRDGFVTNLLNPKAVIFLLAVVSPVLGRRDTVEALAFLLGVVSGPPVWFGLLSTLVGAVAGRSLRRYQRGIDVGCGLLLLSFAAWGALSTAVTT